MKAFRALLGLNFKSLLLTTFNFGRGKNKKKAASSVGALIFLSALMVYISGMLSWSFSVSLGPLGGLDLMLLFLTMMAVVFPLVLTIYSAQSLIFSTKDIDLVLSLPVSSFSIMLARVMALYLEVLLMCELLLLPAGVMYLVNGGAGGPMVLVRMALEGVFLAFLPTVIGVIFGSVITLLVSKLRFKNLFTVVFSLLAVILFMVFMVMFSTSATTADAMNLDTLRSSITSMLPPIGWAVEGMLGNWGSFFLLAAVCVLPFLLFTWVFSLFYKNMLTALSSHAMKRNYKLREVGASGSFTALFKKEARRFFGTPALVLNSGLGIVLIIIGSVVAVFNKSAIEGVLAQLIDMGGGEITAYIEPLLMVVVGFFAGLTYYSGVSISLEGKTLWILKEAPLGTGRIFAAKVGLNALLGVITCLISFPLLGIAFGLPWLNVIAMMLVCILFCSFISIAGLFVNLLFPRMDAENETMVIKNSASSLITMLLSFVTLGLMVGLYFLVRSFGFVWFLAAAALALGALCLLALALLNTTGRKLFAAL